MLTEVPDLSKYLRPGDSVMWGQSHAQPLTLIRALVAQRHRIGPLRIFLGIGHALEDVLTPAVADSFRFSAYCGTGSNRRLARAGVLDILPSHYSELPQLIRSRALPVDVLMLRVSPPDEQGRFSLGMAREYLVAALAVARTVIAEVDEGTPWTHGGPYLHENDIDLLVRSQGVTPVP